MAFFNREDVLAHRPDWELMRNGPVTLYFKPAILDEQLVWLRERGYRVVEVDCSNLNSEGRFHTAISEALDFPDYYGNNLNALNDCLCDIDIPDNAGLVLVFRRYDVLAKSSYEVAHAVLDIIASQSRAHLLSGRRFMTLVQSNDPQLRFAPIGACAVGWNREELLDKHRGP